jgi:hypothetical protein
MPSPTLFNKRAPGVSRRQRAIAMFLAGATLDEVISTLGLKRNTAGSYLFDARCTFEAQKRELLK